MKNFEPIMLIVYTRPQRSNYCMNLLKQVPRIVNYTKEAGRMTGTGGGERGRTSLFSGTVFHGDNEKF